MLNILHAHFTLLYISPDKITDSILKRKALIVAKKRINKLKNEEICLKKI